MSALEWRGTEALRRRTLQCGAWCPDRRQRQCDHQARVGIDGANGSSMKLNRARDDRQPEADATSGCMTAFVDSKERLENIHQQRIGHAGAAVPHADLDL